MRIGVLLVLLVFLGVTPVTAQSTPEETVRAFFKAERDGRWLDAARMLDLNRFEPIRQSTLRNLATRPSIRRMTAEELMKWDPDMPRAVAEYQVKQMKDAPREYDVLSHEFAHVTSADSLRVLSTDQAAARWLEAKGPRWKSELAFRESRRRPLPGCADIPDSIRAKFIDEMEMRIPVARVLGATAGPDSVRYVVVGEMYDAGNGAGALDQAISGLGMSPNVMMLRNIAGRWKLVPMVDMPQSSGLNGSTTSAVGISCTSIQAGDSARKK